MEFFQASNSVGQALSSPYTVTWNNVQPGFYSLTARATDAVGAMATSGPVSVSVYSPINPSTNFFWVGGISGDWFTPGNWSPTGVPRLFDVANITNGSTVTLSNNLTISALNLSAGTLNGSGNLSVSNLFNWTGGTLGCPLTLPSGASMNLSGNGAHNLQSGLTNAGTANWLGGALNINGCAGPAGPIVNLASGVWNIQCDQTLNQSCASTNAYFQNAGTVQKSATTGATVISIPMINSGQVTTLSGTLNFNGGGSVGGTFNAAGGAVIDFSGGSFSGAGAAINGPGLIQFNGGSLALASNVIPNLALTGGTVFLGSNFQGGAITNLTLSGSTLAGTNAVTGMLNWVAGTVTGPLTIASSGVLNLNGSGVAHLQSALTNAGTVNWSGGTLEVNNCSGPAGPIVNLAGGVWNILCDQTLSQSCASASSYFQNAGTVQKSVTTGTTSFSIPFNNSGLVSVLSGTLNFNGGGTIAGTFGASSGAALNFSGGGFSTAGAVVNGPGAVQFSGGTLTLLSSVVPNLALTGGTVIPAASFQGGTITNLTLSGCTLGSTNAVTGTLNWNGGAVTGPLTITSSGVLNLNGSGTVYLENALTNGGLVNWSSGRLTVYSCLGPAGPIVNLAGGVWNIQCDQTLDLSCSSTNAFFQNAGAVQKSVTTGTTYLSLPFYNSGTLAPHNGTLALNGNPGYAQTGATLDFEISNLSTAGHMDIAGNVSFDGTLIVNALNPYVPGIGDSLSLVSYGSRTGAFSSLSLPPLGAGQTWQLSYAPTELLLQVASGAGFTGQITGSVTDNLGHGVTNLSVFAYTTNASGLYVSGRTDANGNYTLNVATGNWLVGLQGLPTRGYNSVPNQAVTVSSTNPVVNFVLQPFTGQTFSITTSVNPPGAGTTSGGGTFAPGSTVTVTATPITTTLPWQLASWTENGVFESASSSYSFTASQNRQLVANFTLPLYIISVTNVPAGAGTVTGAGSYFYGATNVLMASPNFGYNFGSWTEGANTVGTEPDFSHGGLYQSLVYGKLFRGEPHACRDHGDVAYRPGGCVRHRQLYERSNGQLQRAAVYHQCALCLYFSAVHGEQRRGEHQRGFQQDLLNA